MDDTTFRFQQKVRLTNIKVGGETRKRIVDDWTADNYKFKGEDEPILRTKKRYARCTVS